MAELKIEQDTLRDTVTINGVRYPRALFEDIAAVPTGDRVIRAFFGPDGASVQDIDLAADAQASRTFTFDEWWEDHGKHNAAYLPPHKPSKIERLKELMKLAWDVAIADGRRHSDPTPSGAPSDWVDANVSGNPTLMQAMKNFAENGARGEDDKNR